MSPILISQRVAGAAKKPRMWIGRWTLTGHWTGHSDRGPHHVYDSGTGQRDILLEL